MYDDIKTDDEYTIERQTNHGDYVAVVKIEKKTRKQFIELYRVATEVPKIFRWFSVDRVFINNRVLDRHGDVHNTITKLITEYEFPLYQKSKAEERGHFLEIDYEKELKKRRERMQQKEEEETALKTQIQVNDWMDQVMKRQKELQEQKPKKNMTVNQYRNLPQYSGMTDEEIRREINKR